MPSTYLHIVAFDVPFPADYGGVIDIYYKIKALQKEGVGVILHCFEYGRKQVKELDEVCFRVHYYPRKSGLLYQLKRTPYIVNTRKANSMPENLLNDPFPVLFEGIHTTGLLKSSLATGKKCLVRTHNIEHEYYAHMARSETNLWRKFYLLAESGKLKSYEKTIALANHLLAISRTDAEYFNTRYGNTIYIPPFHRFDEIHIRPGNGNYLLYHGNLGVAENTAMLYFLIRYVFPGTPHRVIIAGKNPPPRLTAKLMGNSRLELIANPNDRLMEQLIADAQVNILVTRQSTGLKLKLLHALHAGRHCLANRAMIDGTGLEDLCHVADSPGELIALANELMYRPFGEDEILLRKRILGDYSNRVGAGKILRLIV